jgi:hypothetical protein
LAEQAGGGPLFALAEGLGDVGPLDAFLDLGGDDLFGDV